MNPETAPDPGESLVSLIEQLHGQRDPPSVSMMPATDAWWVLGAVIALLVAAGVWLWLRRRRANAYRRAALARLRELEPALASGDAGAAARLNQLLRRTALAAFPRTEVAALTGAEWAAYLDRTAQGLPSPGFQGLLPTLENAPYKHRPDAVDGKGLARLAQHWIRHHHA